MPSGASKAPLSESRARFLEGKGADWAQLLKATSQQVCSSSTRSDTPSSTPLSTGRGVKSVFANRDAIAWEIVSEQARLKRSADEICENARLAYGVKAVFMSIVVPAGSYVIGSVGFDLEFLPRAKPGKFDFGHYLAKRRLPTVILDTTEDDRCSESPIVAELGHRFYVATPIVVHGEYVGALCILDDKPRASFLLQEAKHLDQSADRLALVLTGTMAEGCR
jgi:hypothetical protein